MTHPPALRCGLEFEYLLRDLHTGQIRDFSNLDFHALSDWLADKPGQQDPGLAVGDMGIRRGYWYLEGDERFDPDGRFRTLAVKGVEIRTAPEASVEEALQKLLGIEQQLAHCLAPRGLGLAITALNPQHARYDFDPPLNAFERQLRAEDHEYDGMEVSTLTFGPDINLSFAGWNDAQALDTARKLNHYAPFIVPFSFSSPFLQGQPWAGWSRRTWVRSHCRPIVKTFIDPDVLAGLSQPSALLRPARIAAEVGRIEFKAFDAMASVALLKACCYLVIGLCLDSSLNARSDLTPLSLLRRAAWHGFDDPEIAQGAEQVVLAATHALEQAGFSTQPLTPLVQALAEGRTPAHQLRALGQSFFVGGLRETH